MTGMAFPGSHTCSAGCGKKLPLNKNRVSLWFILLHFLGGMVADTLWYFRNFPASTRTKHCKSTQITRLVLEYYRLSQDPIPTQVAEAGGTNAFHRQDEAYPHFLGG